jgi:hypothetical protein
VSAQPEPRRPLLRVVRGDATPEEVSALVAVLSAASAGARAGDPAPAETSTWNDRTVTARRPLPHGPGAWRSSALPH